VLLFFLDLPWLTDGQNTAAPLLAAYADPWPGPVAVMRSATDDNYALDATLTKACGFGVLAADFWSGPPWHWDMVNSLKVTLTNGTLSSATDMAVYGGANALAIQNAEGGWEVVQFVNAELTGPGAYTLTRLLRGRRGSEGQMRDAVAAGARVVVLDGALAQGGMTAAEARRPFHYRWGPANRPLSDISWQGAAQSFDGVGLMPFAPGHVRFSWEGGDLVLRWRRRDRAPSAASLIPAETAMSESREAYDAEICDAGGAVVRTFAGLDAPTLTYGAAQQAADFPAGLPDPLTVNLYQLSSMVGRGRQKKETLYVR
jgi:hypothetical protein